MSLIKKADVQKYFAAKSRKARFPLGAAIGQVGASVRPSTVEKSAPAAAVSESPQGSPAPSDGSIPILSSGGR
jgi:hypothetical protein